MKNSEITQENIYKMVVLFYTNVLKAKNEVSVIFEDSLGKDLKSAIWQEHIQKLTDFWAMQTLGTWGYNGRPMAPHFHLPIKGEMFASWLKMFFKTIDILYEEETGAIFKERATTIAGNFKRNLGL